ncbi:hypothetical protein V5O48_017458 [Marasmius crinis-equi]|uniref:Uncharacterized protein n=1 Tax=Marasmius crinis-equi TaxID=585013 RepID=A0ABR3ENW3_9AGAR
MLRSHLRNIKWLGFKSIIPTASSKHLEHLGYLKATPSRLPLPRKRQSDSKRELPRRVGNEKSTLVDISLGWPPDMPHTPTNIIKYRKNRVTERVGSEEQGLPSFGGDIQVLPSRDVKLHCSRDTVDVCRTDGRALNITIEGYAFGTPQDIDLMDILRLLRASCHRRKSLTLQGPPPRSRQEFGGVAIFLDADNTQGFATLEAVAVHDMLRWDNGGRLLAALEVEDVRKLRVQFKAADKYEDGIPYFVCSSLKLPGLEELEMPKVKSVSIGDIFLTDVTVGRLLKAAPPVTNRTLKGRLLRYLPTVIPSGDLVPRIENLTLGSAFWETRSLDPAIPAIVRLGKPSGLLKFIWILDASFSSEEIEDDTIDTRDRAAAKFFKIFFDRALYGPAGQVSSGTLDENIQSLEYVLLNLEQQNEATLAAEFKEMGRVVNSCRKWLANTCGLVITLIVSPELFVGLHRDLGNVLDVEGSSRNPDGPSRDMDDSSSDSD